MVFLHGGGGGVAGDVYDFTTIRQKAASYDLTGDPLRPGFHLLSVQGRSLHYPTENDRATTTTSTSATWPLRARTPTWPT